MDTIQNQYETVFLSEETTRLREDLALALRAAAFHGFSEGVCNHFSVEVPACSDWFLLNPRGFQWSEIQADDIVMVDANGNKLWGRHEIEPTALFIHAAVHRIARKKCVLHTHMPYATSLTLTENGGLDPLLSQNAMRFYNRIAIDRTYNGLALDHAEGERIAHAMNGADVAFLTNHGPIVCGESIAYAYDDLYYLERASQVEVIAHSSGLPLRPVSEDLAKLAAVQIQQERLQSTLFFESLRRML